MKINLQSESERKGIGYDLVTIKLKLKLETERNLEAETIYGKVAETGYDFGLPLS